MNLLSWGYVVVAAVCGTVAVQHLMVAARLRERRIHVVFALTSLAAAVDALVQRRFLAARGPADAEAYFAWSAVSISLFAGCLVWFVAFRTGAVRRWLLWTVTGLLAATAAIDFILPTGVPAFMRVQSVRDVTMPWGEIIRVAEGTPAAWRLVGDLANVAFLSFLLDTTVRLVRQSRRREALLAGGSLLAIGLTVLAIIPMDLGLLVLPTLHPFAFLLIVAGMTWDLSDRVARAATLSQEIRSAERARDEVSRDLERSARDLENLKQRLEQENLLLREAAGQEVNRSSIVGSSPALMYVLHKVQHVAPTGATVLLSGETGVGKELVARMIHRESDRASSPFVAVNCAALPPSLVESELFGHERGAFTGADRVRRGRFELATGGTLFLDEITELPLELQPKLLRALQEGQIERVGADRTLDVDVRFIAATNRDLREEVDAGRFRQDLFYRLDVYPITIPPLRDRLEDIPALVECFARRVSAREGIRVDEIPHEVLRHLAQHRWPGNVRELQNIVERAVLRCTDGVLRLAEPLVKRSPEAVPAGGKAAVLRPTLDELQRDYIRRVLQECNGQIAGRGGAAKVLGLHPNTLRSRMHKLGIAAESLSRPSRTAELEHGRRIPASLALFRAASLRNAPQAGFMAPNGTNTASRDEISCRCPCLGAGEPSFPGCGSNPPVVSPGT